MSAQIWYVSLLTEAGDLLQDDYIECLRKLLERKHLAVSSIEQHALCQLRQQLDNARSGPKMQCAFECLIALVNHQAQSHVDVSDSDPATPMQPDPTSILQARERLLEQMSAAAATPAEECLLLLRTLKDILSSTPMLTPQTSSAKHAEATNLQRCLASARIEESHTSIKLSLDKLVPSSSIQKAAKLVALQNSCKPSRARMGLEQRLQAGSNAAADRFLHMISTVASIHMLWLEQAMSINTAKVQLLAEHFPEIVSWQDELCLHIVGSVRVQKGQVVHTLAAADIFTAGYFLRSQQSLNQFMQQLGLSAELQQRHSQALAQFEGFSIQVPAGPDQESLAGSEIVPPRRNFVRDQIQKILWNLTKTLQEARTQRLIPFHLIAALRR